MFDLTNVVLERKTKSCCCKEDNKCKCIALINPQCCLVLWPLLNDESIALVNQ